MRTPSILFVHPLVILTSIGVPYIALAATPRDLPGLANMLASILNGGTTFLVVLAMVIFFWGIVRHLLIGSKLWGGGTEFSKTVMGGLMVIFVMVSIWGILRLLQNTLFRNSGNASTNSNTSAPLQFN